MKHGREKRLERPGASGDQGRFEDRIELEGIQGNFPLPDLSAEYRLGRDWVYFEGIENYMNDSSVDIGVERDPGNPRAPIKGVPLPILGVVAFLDHSWGTRAAASDRHHHYAIYEA